MVVIVKFLETFIFHRLIPTIYSLALLGFQRELAGVAAAA